MPFRPSSENRAPPGRGRLSVLFSWLVGFSPSRMGVGFSPVPPRPRFMLRGSSLSASVSLFFLLLF